MKNLYYWAFMLLLPLQASCKEVAPELKLTVEVVDDQGNPVEGAEVKVSGNVGVKPSSGGGFGKTVYNKSEKTTGKDGRADMSVRFFNHYSLYVDKEGYYRTVAEQPKVELAGGRWVPSVKVFRVALKPVKSPVPMYAKNFKEVIPSPDREYGYDLMAGDWVAPHGKGSRADIFVSIRGYWNSFKDHSSRLTVRFASEQDGIVQYRASPKKGSFLRSAYLAPAKGYARQMSWSRCRNQEEGIKEPSQADANYYIRVRTVLDGKGNIKSAFYGKIYGDMDFGGVSPKGEGSEFKWGTYYLNPTPNDRNVEFDPKKNLIDTGRRGFKVQQP